MTDPIVVSIITSITTILVTIITIVASNTSTRKAIEIKLAVMEEQIRNLHDEVEKHNDFPERISKLEARLDALEKKG